MPSGAVNYTDLFNGLGPGADELKQFTTAVGELNRNFKAFSKNVDADGQRIATGLAAIKEQTSGLREQAAGLAQAALAEGTSLRILTAEVTRLAQQQQQLQQAEAGASTSKKLAEEATRSYTTELKKQRDALREAYAANDAERIVKAATAIQNLKTQTEDLNRALRGANSSFTAANGSYRAMENEARALDTQLKALAGGMQADSTQAQQLKARLAEVNQAMISFGRDVNSGYRNVGRYAESIIEAVGALEKQRASLLANAQALTTQARAANLSADQQDHLQSEIKQTEAELGKVNGQLRSYGVGVQQGSAGTSALSKNVGGLVQSFAGAYYGIQGVATALQQAFDNNVQYSDALTDVRKTTGLTAEATDQLAENLKKVDTRTTLSGLLDIAKVGGQLGIAGKDIEAFTKSIDIAVQALGDDFSGGAEQIATELGKISTVFRKELGEDQASNIIRIGSAVNQLGAEGAATAPFLTDVALRTGAVASSARLGLKDVLAYAATLQETGFTAEVSGTSLNRLFNTLSTKSKEAYEIAKLANPALTLKDFKRLVNTDFQGAITAFLRGLREGGTSTTKFNALLGTLKLQSGEAKAVITTLAQNVELLGQKQATANEQLKEGTSLGAEAAIKNDNLAGSWAKLKNDVGNFFTSGTAGSVIKFFVDYVRNVPGALAGAGLRTFADGFTYLKDKVTGAEKPQKDFAAATVTQITAIENQAAAQQKLVDSYTTLAATANRTEAQRLALAKTRAQLITQFGTAEADVIQSGINQQLLAAESHKQVLRQDLANYDKSTEELLQKAATFQEQLNAQNAGFTAQQIAQVQAVSQVRLAEERSTGKPFELKGKSLNPELEQAIAASLTLERTEKQLGVQQATRAQIVAALASITQKATGDTRAEAGAIDDSTEATKKKKVAVADLAKEEAELAKQRLDERLTDLTRQADNPANTEALRADALQKAAAVRLNIARVERDELIREAAAKFKGQVNGEQALGVATTRLTEAYSAKKLAITRDTDKALLALHRALLDQLGEIDKLTIAGELVALDRIIGNETAGYQERQQAAADAAARRIELVAISAEQEVRAAQGSAERITAIRQKQANDTAAILRSEKAFDSERANQAVAYDYTQQQTELEQARAKGLITERAYADQVRVLHLTQLREELANLETGVDNEKAIAEKKLEIARSESDGKVRIAQATEQKRQQIIQESLQLLGTFSDAYFSTQSAQNQAQLEEYQHQKEAELTVAGDNAELKAQVEENARKRELALKRKQAEQDKTQALFNVALSTAQGVIRAVAEFPETFGLPFSAFVAAAGLAQAAVIQARPLPNYFVGRKDGPAELAVVAERGPELIGQPGSFRVAAQQGITRLAAGDRVFTAPETRDVLRDHELVAGRLVARNELDQQQAQVKFLRAASPHNTLGRAAELQAQAQQQQVRFETDRLIKAMGELPLYQIEEDGIFRYTQKQHSVTKIRASRYMKDQ